MPSQSENPATRPIAKEAIGVAIVAALGIVVFFFHLGTYGLWEPDEARYAEIAREMLALRDFVVPHLNYVPYIEKPPLLFWLTALAIRSFGVNEFAARFVNASAALTGVGAVYFFSRRVFGPREAFWSAVMLVTTALYALMAQVLTTDMLLTATLTIALLAFFLQWSEGGRWCWVMYVAIALAVLSKGPIGIAIPIAVGAIFLILEGDWRGALKRFRVIPGLILTAAIVVPWFVAVAARAPGFIDFYFVGEHFRRFFESSYSHGQPFYYYVPVILAGTLPWSLLVPLVRWQSLTPHPARRFCLIAAITIFVIFSIASAKLIPYILPAIPPLTIVIASGVLADLNGTGQVQMGSRRFAVSGPMLGLIGACVLMVAIFADRFASPNALTVRPALYAAGAILLMAGEVCFAAFWARWLAAGLATIAAASCATLIVASYGRIMAESLRSYAGLAQTIAQDAPTARLICYPRYIQSLPFYTRRRVILVGAATELAYGATHSPDGGDYFFSRRADLVRLWNDPAPTVLIADKGAFQGLAGSLGPYTVIAEDAKKIAVEHAPPAGVVNSGGRD